MTAQLACAFAHISARLDEKVLNLAPNWQGLDAEDCHAALNPAACGMPMVWVPSVEVVKALVHADEGGVDKVLVEYQDQILIDCRATLLDCRSDDSRMYVEALGQAVTALTVGLYIPAQSGAVNVIDALLQTEVKSLRRWRKVPEKLGNAPYYARIGAVNMPLVRVLEEFRSDDSTAVPSALNRHATVHLVNKQQTHL
ncbi:hypothetical protein [Fodinicola acaciae]|uniref:hypothetical protein n=1 Tax=Fodinicola acaciae TaxID=2681555 RepID=UPI0013D84FE5|nr:hypothetical protein [Fodinicola acaciae]